MGIERSCHTFGAVAGGAAYKMHEGAPPPNLKPDFGCIGLLGLPGGSPSTSGSEPFLRILSMLFHFHNFLPRPRELGPVNEIKQVFINKIGILGTPDVVEELS